MLENTIRLRPTQLHALGVTPADNPRQLGNYRLVREIGRGGMGIVYEAEQQSLRRRVAVKVMAGPGRWDAEARERFEREARSAARLHHTNIVPIIEVGIASDECFYAMQYIDGIGLDALLERMTGATKETHAAPTETFAVPKELASPDHPDHFRALARLALQVAAGLAHAHVRGVVHRDIKPANLLLDSAGVVWIADFGLAKHADDKLTQPGDLFGTIRYMAPESFHGRGDSRSDIYALGTTLYELVTRTPAYPNVTDPSQFARLALDPPRPSALEPRIPRDLETIIQKAMDKNPAHRYASAQDFGDDLRRFLDNEPIRARPIGPLGRAARWARRRPLLASLTAAVLALTATVIVGAIAAAITFHDLAENEVGLRHDADAATETARQQAKVAVAANLAAQEIATLMLGILDEADPLAPSGRLFGGHGSQRREQFKPEELLKRTLTRLDSAPEIGPKVRATLLDKIGAIYVSLGHFEHAGPLLEQALTLRRAEFGPDSLETAETWHHLGMCHGIHRYFEPALNAYRQALAIRERALGPEHPLVTVTLMHLAVANAFNDEGSETIAILRRAQANLRKHSGADSREYGIAVGALALALLQEGHVDEATPLLPEAMRLLQKHEGNSDLGRVVRLSLHGRLASKIGLHAQAANQYREAIHVAANALGPEHFLVILGRNVLAGHLHENMADLNAALVEYEAVRRLYEKSLGVQSTPNALAKIYQARVLRDLKRFAEAEPLLQEASEVLRQRKHLELGRCLHILWEVRHKQGKVAEGLTALHEAVRERKKGKDLVWYSNAASDLARVLESLGRRAEAAFELRDATLHIAQQPALPPNVQKVLAYRSANLCRLLMELGGRDSEADEAANIAIDALRALLDARAATARDLEKGRGLNSLRNRPAFQQLLAEAKR